MFNLSCCNGQLALFPVVTFDVIGSKAREIAGDDIVATVNEGSCPWQHRDFKVTVYLQGCLAYKRCSASGLNCRYLKPYIKLKLIGLAIRLYQQF